LKFLYVLTSGKNDYYYELFLLSAASLKLKTPNADITLICDSKSKETLTGKRCEYEKFITDVITIEAPASMSQIEVSRLLKTSMRRLVQGDFLFIDCDTIVAEDLSSISELGIQFGACLDKHSLINRHSKSDSIIEKDKKLKFTSHLSNKHYNSGVIYCTDTPETRKIFDRWHELWIFSNSKKIPRDQPSFNMAIYENLKYFTELDGTWNCQISFNSLPYLLNSKIIHFFATDMNIHTSPLVFVSKEILKQIKNTGLISEKIYELLKNPKAAFEPESRIITGEEMLYVVNSDLFEFIFLLRNKIPFFFNFLNLISSTGKKIAKFFMIRTSRKKDNGIKHYD